MKFFDIKSQSQHDSPAEKSTQGNRTQPGNGKSRVPYGYSRYSTSGQGHGSGQGHTSGQNYDSSQGHGTRRDYTRSNLDRINDPNSVRTPRNNLRMYLSIVCVVIIVYSIFAHNTGGPTAGIRINPDGIRLYGPPEMEKMFVAYDTLTSIEAVDHMDYGEKIDGVDTSDYCYGTWKNDEYGTYGLCIDPDIHTYVVAKTADGTFVFNYEAESTTAQIPQSVYDYLEKTSNK